MKLKFRKKNWVTILWLVLIVLLIVPQTRFSIKVFVNKILLFSPNTVEEDGVYVSDFHWPLQRLSGENINFKEAKGKIAFINFWATWCAPCIAEMPSLKKLYTDYKDKVDFYFVTKDSKKNVIRYLREERLEIPVYFPLTKAPAELVIETLPTTYLVDQNGKIIVKEYGTADWNGQLAREILDRLLLEN